MHTRVLFTRQIRKTNVKLELCPTLRNGSKPKKLRSKCSGTWARGKSLTSLRIVLCCQASGRIE
eukprot:27889-Rhodomonas_salina.1